MPGLLYSAYAIAVLIVAVGGLLAVIFGTPDVEGRSDYRYETLTIVAAVFIVAMIGGFVL
ncbi:hypothetical protein CV102_25510 [Natronococcus pandeyae]|uniref:Uncharacterized protein n=1 Tax=Natronococcus pandeyae TaxID=2055836 RepID=A0A8J8PY99_9EURY|nr:hypothetical protein [Natronococcus pandeyae]TYL35867.1 hypothetical protein CV102_25510 [Natronococcus pandeyae]